MRAKYEPIKTRIMVIVHGKSEYCLCKNIFSNLRIKHEIYANNRGKNSIQINGLKNILNNRIFKDPLFFRKQYEDIEYQKSRPVNFRLFIIMDVDDCESDMKKKFISRDLFKDHWLYEYITPIFNDPHLEKTMNQIGVEIEKKKEYIKIFPTIHGDSDKKSICELLEKLKSCSSTNLEIFLDYCVQIAESNKIK